jgi:hypothetical protein
MIQINLIDESTEEIFTTVELDDETVELIKKTGMTIEEGVKKALTEIVLMHEKDPKVFGKMMMEKKEKSKSP